MASPFTERQLHYNIVVTCFVCRSDFLGPRKASNKGLTRSHASIPLKVACHSKSTTVEPPNNGHFGDQTLVEAVCYLEVNKAILWCNG